MARSVFYGFGAFVGSITGPTTCGWWDDDPAVLGWDPAKQYHVDLGKNPEAARRGLIRIDEIQADDYAGYSHGGLTQIGPMWPGGKLSGACYVESNHWNNYGARKPKRVAAGVQAHQYEFSTVLYWDGDLAGRRFIGLHAEIRQPPPKGSTRAVVAVWAPGTSQVPGKAPHGTFVIDFATDVHPIEPDFTEIGINAGDPQTGALFLSSNTFGAMSAPGSKTPRWLGGGRRIRARYT